MKRCDVIFNLKIKRGINIYLKIMFAIQETNSINKLLKLINSLKYIGIVFHFLYFNI